MESNLLTIGIVTKNRKQLLKRLLTELNVIIDNGQVTEIIIADGSNPDERLVENDILKLALSANNIKILMTSGGEAIGRNLVLSNCQTKWLFFLDDDCIPQKDILNAFSFYIERNDNNIGLICGLTHFTGKKTKAFRACYLTPFIYPFKIALNKNDPDWGTTVCALFNTDALINNTGFDQNCPVPVSGTDVDIGIRLKKNGYKVVMCPKAVVFHTTDTWISLKVNIKRFFTWGRSEAFLVEKHPNRLVDGTLQWLKDIIKGQKKVAKEMKFGVEEYCISYMYLAANTMGYYYQCIINKNIRIVFKRFKFYLCEYMNLKIEE